MRRMEKITGRTDDMMIIRGVNVFPTQIEELIVKDDRLAPHYQIELFKSGNMDAMRAHVERDASVGADAGAAAGSKLAKSVKDLIGISIAVELHAPGEIARSEGKAQRIIDNRSK